MEEHKLIRERRNRFSLMRTSILFLSMLLLLYPGFNTAGATCSDPAFAVTPSKGYVAGDLLSFDASCWLGTGVTDYTWMFGDGTRGSGMIVQHSYPKPGLYITYLTVAFAGGLQSSYQVLGISTPSTHYPHDAVVGQKVVFDASYYVDNSRSLTYSWDFGTAVVEGVVATWVYDSPGTYIARLTIREGGVVAEGEETVTVGSGDAPLVEVWSEGSRSENVFSPGLRPGTSFDVQLRVVGMTEFNGYDIMLGYDPKILKASHVSFAGTIFGPENLPILVDLTASGEVGVSSVAGSGGTYNGDGLLATVTFDVLGTGGTALDVHDDVIAFGGTAVAHNRKDGGFQNRYGRGLLGDVNGDKTVNIFDAATLALSYGKNISDLGYITGTDINRDSSVAITDAAILALNYGQSDN